MSVPPPLPQHDPYAAPTARVDDQYQGELVLADRVTRLLAAIVDTLLVAGPPIAMAILIPAMTGPSGQNNEAMLPVAVGLGLLPMIIVLGWNALWLHQHGQTIAKRLFNIRIVRSDGSRCSLLRVIFARWLPMAVLGAIPLVGPVMTLIDPLFIFRSDYRCLHDLIADTIVVRA